MKKILTIMLITILLLGVMTGLYARKYPSASSILKKIDEDFTSVKDFKGIMVVYQKRPKHDDKILTMEYYRKDKGDMFMLFFLKPKVDKGKGYLFKNKTLYYYDPKTRKTIKKTKIEGVGGTDTKSRDYEKSTLNETFSGKVTGIERVTIGTRKKKSYNCYVLKLRAKKSDVAYPIVKMWITKARGKYFIIKRQEYSLSGRLAQTITYEKYLKKGKLFYPGKTVVVNNIEKGRIATMYNVKLIFTGISSNIFSSAYLEKRNR